MLSSPINASSSTVASPLWLATLSLAAACTSHTRTPVTSWLDEVSWVKESLIAESGRPRGTYLERRDPNGDIVRIDGWGCTSMADGDAALCIVDGAEPGVLLWRSGRRRAVACGGPHFDDERARLTTMGPFAAVTKATERELSCIERYYEPVFVEVTTRQDLEGHEIGRSEVPMPRGAPQ